MSRAESRVTSEAGVSWLARLINREITGLEGVTGPVRTVPFPRFSRPDRYDGSETSSKFPNGDNFSLGNDSLTLQPGPFVTVASRRSSLFTCPETPHNSPSPHVSRTSVYGNVISASSMPLCYSRSVENKMITGFRHGFDIGLFENEKSHSSFAAFA